MNNPSGSAQRVVARYLFTGVEATICTVAAMGSWVSLAFAGMGAAGLTASAARQRRGRVS